MALAGNHLAVVGSLLTLPARLTVRTARTVLTTTRDLSEQALGTLDLIAQLVEVPPSPAGRGAPDLSDLDPLSGADLDPEPPRGEVIDGGFPATGQ